MFNSDGCMEEFVTRNIAFSEQTTVDFITFLYSVVIVDPRPMVDPDLRSTRVNAKVSCICGGHLSMLTFKFHFNRLC